MTTFTAIIPARAGSKRIPRKNLAAVGGKPLVAWTIAAALEASAVRRVIVSTDDPEIASVAKEWGADVPFLRPAHLATDEARSVDVVAHVLESLDPMPGAIILMQPTSPLRAPEDVDGAARLFEKNGASAVVSVTRLDHPLEWVRRIGAGGELIPYVANKVERSQDAEELYVLNGALYVIGAETLLRERTFAPAGTLAYPMPPERSLDVDEPWQLRVADALLRDSHAA
jgi:CMP-N,N'-diacetyllegionaminic acid synthase